MQRSIIREQPPAQVKEKPNLFLYLIFIVTSVFFSLIVIKEMEFSPLFIRLAAVPIVMGTFFYGLRRAEFPFYVLTFYMPFSSVLPGAFLPVLNITNVLIMIVLFCRVFAGGKVGRKKYKDPALSGVILLFCIQNIFSIFQVMFEGFSNLTEVITLLKRWLTPFLLYYITLMIVHERRIMKNIVTIMMIVLFGVGVAMSLNAPHLSGIGDALMFAKSRSGGIFEQPNSMGAFFVYYMFLFLSFFYIYWKDFRYWIMLIPFAACMEGISATYSRGAYVAFVFGLMGMTFVRQKMLFLVICFLGGIALLNPQWLPQRVQFAIDRTVNYAEVYDVPQADENLDPSVATRLEIWKGGLQMIRDYPLLGVGFGQFSRHIAWYVPAVGPKDAHNTYLIIAAEMGVFALLIFLVMLGMITFKTLWVYLKVEDRMIKAIALGLLGGLFGVLVANMFGSRLNSGAISAYFWILTAIIVKAEQMKKAGDLQ